VQSLDFTPSLNITMRFENHPPTHVQAEVLGQWAVHVTYGQAKLRDPYTVTHVPTGARVLVDIPLEEARRLAAELNERVPAFEHQMGPDWEKAAPIVKEVVNALQIAA
jgi:hypothetical protein